MSLKSIEPISNILSFYLNSGGVIRPHFFLTGPTGSGKTHTVTKLAEELGEIPVININTAQITSEGLAGNSISKALVPLLDYQSQPVIVFFDEFDKAISQNSELTCGNLQNELLKILEGDTTDVFGAYGKFDKAQTSQVLFVFGGSFNGSPVESLEDLQELGVMPELLGRVGLHFSIEKATLEDLINLVKKSDLLQSYLELCPHKNRDEAEKAIIQELTSCFDTNIIGIRVINSLIHQYFINGSFSKQAEPKKHKQPKFSPKKSHVRLATANH